MNMTQIRAESSEIAVECGDRPKLKATFAWVTLASLLMLAFAAPTCAADQVPVLTGNYNCAGLNPGGGEYEGFVLITKNGDTYTMQWTVGKGEKYTGTGIVTGDVLSATWRVGNTTGIASYKINADGPNITLKGYWTTHPSTGKVWYETLTR